MSHSTPNKSDASGPAETGASAAEKNVGKKSKNRRPIIGVGAAIIILIVIALILFWKHCRRGGGKGGGKSKPAPEASMKPPAMKQMPAGACKLRVDAKGLSLKGKTIEVPAAVTACKTAGGAEVLITGDALQGQAKAIEAALKAAGIKAIIRRPAAGATDAAPPGMAMSAPEKKAP